MLVVARVYGSKRTSIGYITFYLFVNCTIKASWVHIL